MQSSVPQPPLSVQQQRFIEVMLAEGVLRFGSFITKSGRETPYFFNTGLFHSGRSISAVAGFYAEALRTHFPAPLRYLFGPAYKGIPLVVATAQRLSQEQGADVFFTFDRKESKDHGEGGALVGYPYVGGEEVVIVEDVLTGGTSLRASIELLAAYGVRVMGAVVGIDRGERGRGNDTARRELEREYGVPIHSILEIDALVAYLSSHEVLGQHWLSPTQQALIAAYRHDYGCS